MFKKELNLLFFPSWESNTCQLKIRGIHKRKKEPTVFSITITLSFKNFVPFILFLKNTHSRHSHFLMHYFFLIVLNFILEKCSYKNGPILFCTFRIISEIEHVFICLLATHLL